MVDNLKAMRKRTGNGRSRQGRPKDLVLTSVERALKRSQTYPNDALLHCDLGALYLEGKRYDEAEAELAISLKKAPKTHAVMALLGRCEADKGISKRSEHFEAALAENGTQWIANASNDVQPRAPGGRRPAEAALAAFKEFPERIPLQRFASRLTPRRAVKLKKSLKNA